MNEGRKPRLIQQLEDQRIGQSLVPDLRIKLGDFLRTHVPPPQNIREYMDYGILRNYPISIKGQLDRAIFISPTELRGIAKLDAGDLEVSLSGSAYPYEETDCKNIDFKLTIEELDTQLIINPEHALVESISTKSREMRLFGGYIPSLATWARQLTKQDYEDFTELLDWVEKHGLIIPVPYRLIDKIWS